MTKTNSANIREIFASETGTTPPVIKSKSAGRVALLAILLVAVVSVTATASGVFKDHFGLVIGSQTFDLDPLEIIAFDRESLENYARESGTGPEFGYYETDENGRAHPVYFPIPEFSTQEELKNTTGLVLAKSDKIMLSNISINIWSVPGEAKIAAEYKLDDAEGMINAIFLLEGTELNGVHGYGTDLPSPYRVYNYGDGKKAYIVKDLTIPYMTIFMTEDGICYQISVNKSWDYQTGKKVVDAIVGR